MRAGLKESVSVKEGVWEVGREARRKRRLERERKGAEGRGVGSKIEGGVREEGGMREARE